MKSATACFGRSLRLDPASPDEPQAALRSLGILRRYRPDIRVRDATSAMHFPADFVARIGNGLSDLSLP